MRYQNLMSNPIIMSSMKKNLSFDLKDKSAFFSNENIESPKESAY